jgi:hypothetical protein
MYFLSFQYVKELISDKSKIVMYYGFEPIISLYNNIRLLYL